MCACCLERLIDWLLWLCVCVSLSVSVCMRCHVQSREIKLLSDVLYYSQTLGTRQPSLGEEYCAIRQIIESNQTIPGRWRGNILSLLHGLSPYVAQKVQSGSQISDQLDSGVDVEIQSFLRSPQDGSRWSSSDNGGNSNVGCRILKQLYVRGVQKLASAGAKYGNSCRSIMRVLLPRRAKEMAWKTSVILYKHQTVLLRVHLALFYVFGVYYEIPKRIIGARYSTLNWQVHPSSSSMDIGNTKDKNKSYMILGYMLLLQVSIGWLHTLLGARKASSNKHVASNGTELGQVYLRDYQGNIMGPLTSLKSSAPPPLRESVATFRKKQDTSCPLCLSPRSFPTSTPCGHVFCWYCISEWCCQKSECPLCRSDVVPSQLVVVRHADF